MKNSEKYKSAEERAIAFDVHCRKICTNESGYCNHAACAFAWLDLEAKEGVEDGKDKRPDIDSDMEEASIGLGIHITREAIKKCSPEDAVFRNVLGGEWDEVGE